MQEMNGNILTTTYHPYVSLEDIIADIPQHVNQFSCMVVDGCWKLSRPLDPSEWDEYSHLFGNNDDDPTPPKRAA